MSKASKIILLCEDKLQDVVVRRFLTGKWKVDRRNIRTISYPGGQGSGEQHVRANYPHNLQAYRTRAASSALIAVIDADTKSVVQRHGELDDACKTANIDRRASDEAVMHVIPKRNIETWLAYLAKEPSVNEVDDYKQKFGFKGRESECKVFVDGLAEDCINGAPLASAPPSLEEACAEFSRIRKKLS